MAEPTRREVVAAVRVAARPEALDTASWPVDATVLRTAPDEVLLVDSLDATPPEPDAIVFPDMGWVRFAMAPATGAQVMAHAAAWPPPTAGLGQGLVAGVPAKVVVRDDEWWIIVGAVVADEFEERVAEVLT
ncbi:MAG: hypothetical protein AAGA90_04295 [Actinomycetota bacterium]